MTSFSPAGRLIGINFGIQELYAVVHRTFYLLRKRERSLLRKHYVTHATVSSEILFCVACIKFAFIL